ncbi:acriflavin resistance protein [Helicobacter sp. 13S00401-1]|uniref:efflux RND transporter permease subunit n=1 Tax=Helicobacter sp. 13S00401-1 TaxID=1905758 RepID=UPI000BA65E00|nr:efflux RND transporter permease subunit [Helicobacter sp. 13S00401-1]PAF50194.1 acriflavin resistance protein [Helicobacter sp. 13S00401-1]
MYKLAITRPVTTLMFAIALVFFGIQSLEKIPKALFPDIDIPVVVVITTYPGASPETVETKVTDRIEQAVMGIDGLKSVTSNSARNTSIVTIQFQLDKPIDEAVNDVRDKVSTVQLDSDVNSPTIRKVDTGSTPIVSVFMRSDTIPVTEMMKHANNVIGPMLQRISGVGNVQMAGYRARQIKIYPDPTLMNKYGITYPQLATIIGNQNLEIDGGRLVTSKKEFSVITDANGYTVKDIENIRVKDGLRLKDIAQVKDDLQEEKTYASFDRKQGVIFEVQKITGANEIAIADAVYKELPAMREVSPGYDISIFRDTTTFTRSSIKDVEFDLALGGLLAVIVVFFFLRDFGITIVSAISIPVSVLAVFMLLRMVGYSLNMMTLIAITLSIGIIIDDAIVVIENIHKKLESGLRKREAAYEGVREIGFAIIAISAMLLSVFIPVGTMSGIVGRFFQSFGVTVALAVAVSYVVATTVIPMFSSIIVTPKPSKFYHWSKPFFDKMDAGYKAIVTWIVATKKSMTLVVVVIFGIFGASLYVASTLGNEFMLKEDRSQFMIYMRNTPGISITDMKRKAMLFESLIKKNPYVKYVTVEVGPGTIQSVFVATLYVALKPYEERKHIKGAGEFEIMDQVAKEIRAQPDAKNMLIAPAEVPLVGGGSDNSPFQVVVYAPVEAVMQKSVKKLSEFLKTDPELKGKLENFHLSTSDYQPEYRIHVIKSIAAKYGITAQDIGQAIGAAFSGETRIAYFKEDGKEYDITMRVPDDKRYTPEDIKRLQVRSSDGNLIFLDGLVTITEQTSPSTINRYARQRSITVAATPAHGMSLGQVIDIVNKNKDKWLEPTAGYAFLGQADNQSEASQAFGTAITMAFILIYLILAALYESFLLPLVIMITMPLSFAGAFFAIKLSGTAMSMFSTMGLILLIGMVGKNATLLVDIANEKRKEGMDSREAIIFAGSERLRPILMTTIAMVVGMLPLAIAGGDGSSMKQPIGISMIGGLILSMLLSLLVIPVFYRVVAPLDDKLKNLYKPKKEDKF